MAEWNNTYAYSNQYQDPNMWSNGDYNSQYPSENAAYYSSNGQFPEGNQYVSFDQFLNQMQSSGVAGTSNVNYNDVQYQNYPVNQYSDYSAPSTSHGDTQYNYSYQGNVTNGSEVVSGNSSIPQETDSNSKKGGSFEPPLQSNLTPTATEFVPKSTKPSTTPFNSNKTDSNSHNNKYGSRNNRNSDRNWRDRPSSSSQANGESYTNGGNYRNQDPSRVQESHNQRESSPRSQTYENSRQERNEPPNRYQKPNGKPRNRDDARTYYNSNKSNQDVRNGRGEGSNRNRNWVGSQRVRAVERNNMDDEQFANNYHYYKDDRPDRSDRSERPDRSDRSERPDRSERSDRSERLDRSERPDRSERYERSERSEKGGRMQAGPSPAKNKNMKISKEESEPEISRELTQRERLTQQLDKGTLECLVCCERVRQTDQVWSCSNCYHVLHLRCIRKWAVSSMQEGKWRCPACQNVSASVPGEYRCLCGAVRAPEPARGAGAHTCGRACRRARACPHPCTLLCHPGPCPPCQATVNKQCGCGAETRSVLCSSKLAQVCGRVCRRKLECGVHECTELCHEGPCPECTETITQVCHCPAGASRSLACSAASAASAAWACGAPCGRVLACGAHVCRAPCHAPPCAPCPHSPAHTTTCPCGNMKIEPGARKSCTDPIPLCGNICAKPLPCGPAGDRHFCKQECHEGPCPVCPDNTSVQCRCGHSSRDVPCAQLPGDDVLCQRKCNKKLSCGRHRCRTVCCGASVHRCGAPCGRTLSCQTHRCVELCHTGRCPPCPRLSFSELSCACGAEVLLPPVPCGARAPACSAPCRVPRACGHEPLHACHAPPCPPCVVLTAKKCYAQHEERKTIPCSQEEFSCGLPCGKPLPCGAHTCIKICHKGPCDTEVCTQPCTEKRPVCGHECGAACHAATGSACPAPAPCRAAVRATCQCGRRAAPTRCHLAAQHRDKMLSALAASKMQEGGTVDISEVTRQKSSLKMLECDDECRVEARTRQMALALQIRNPDVSAKLAPRYSEHVRATAGKEPGFAAQVHDALTSLVQLAKKSKQKTRSHSFPSMNWQKRQFIHELCEHFGCKSVAYDAEPNRNVVATADREKSWLPAMSVLEVLSREAGKRRVPGPVLRQPAASTSAGNKPSSTGWATLTSTNAWAARSQQKPAEPKEQPKAEKIDYFDNPPE